MCTVLSFFICLGLFPVAAAAEELVPQGTIPPPEGWAEYAPMENLFRVSGSDKTFILLDHNENGYFVMSYDDYGKVAFDEDNTVVFDVNDPNNIGYFLNNNFLEEGYEDATLNGKLQRLPQGIIDYINPNVIWATEPPVSGAQSYTVQAGVALMSQTEYIAYAGKFGAKDNSRTWQFRTARALSSDGKSILRYFNDTNGHYTSGYPANSALYLRPIFYLQDDFFENVKLNSAYMGKKAKEILSALPPEKLTQLGYTADELMAVTNTGVNTQHDVSINLPYQAVYSSDLEYGVTVFGSGNYEVTVSGAASGSLSVSGKENQTVEKSGTLSSVPSGERTLIFTVRSGNTVIETYTANVLIAQVYQDNSLDSTTARALQMEFSKGISSRDLTMLQSMGIQNVKTSLSWKLMEPAKGEYDFSVCDTWMNVLLAADIQVILQIENDTELYEKAEQAQAIQNLTNALLKRYPKLSAVEVESGLAFRGDIPVLTAEPAEYAFAFADKAGADAMFRQYITDVSGAGFIRETALAEADGAFSVTFQSFRGNNGILDENGEVTAAFDELSLMNQYTQGGLVGGKFMLGGVNGVTYLTEEGVKALVWGGGNLNAIAQNPKILCSFRDGSRLVSGFAEQEENRLLASGIVSAIEAFRTKHAQVMAGSAQSQRMLYQLEQIGFALADANERNGWSAEEQKGNLDKIAAIGQSLCSSYQEGANAVAPENLGEILTDLYIIYSDSATLCAQLSAEKKSLLSNARKLQSVQSAKESADILTYSAYTRALRAAKNGSLAEAEQNSKGILYYDLLLGTVCGWTEALLSGGIEPYETFSVTNDTFSLFGVAEQAEGNATLTVQKSDSAGALRNYDYIGQAKISAEDGSYHFQYKMKGGSGLYTLAVRAGGNEIYRRTFTFASQNETDGFLTELKKVVSEAQVKAVIQNYADLLNLYVPDLVALAQTNAPGTLVYRCILQAKDKITAPQELFGITEQAILLDGLNQAANSAAVKTLLEQYGYLLRLETLNAYKTYRYLLDDKAQAQVLTTLCGKNFKNTEQVKNQYQTAVFLNGVAYATYRDLMSVLVTNADLVTIDYQVYNQLSADNQNAVLKAVAGNSYPSPQAAADAFMRKADEVYKNNQNSSQRPSQSGGSGGGGGGSSIGNASIEIPPTLEQPTENGVFSDLNSVEWAREAIEYLADKGVINGVGTGRFAPDDTVTREEFVKMIVLAFAYDMTDAECHFDDVSADGWAYPYVSVGVQNQVIYGESEQNFGYGKQISRQDAAVILYRVSLQKNLKLTGEKKTFADQTQIADYAVDAVGILSAAGIINGVGDDCFAPLETATRAQAAQLIYKLLRIEEK